MAHDVFHHHDGVVHQNSDGEDQGEQGDAVQGVAVEVEHEQRQCQGDGNGQQDDARFPQAQGEGDQDGHRDNGDGHVKEQFVGFFFGGFPVVPGDGDVHVVRDHRSPGLIHPPEHFIGHRDGVGPLALGDGQGNRRIDAFGHDGGMDVLFFGGRAGTQENILVGFSRPVGDGGHVTQIYRAAPVHTHYHGFDFPARF